MFEIYTSTTSITKCEWLDHINDIANRQVDYWLGYIYKIEELEHYYKCYMRNNDQRQYIKDEDKYEIELLP